MEEIYREGDVVIINENALGRLKLNEIGVISRVDFNVNDLYPYTVFSVADPYRHDVYGGDEIHHLF